MAKRTATSDLNHENWDREEDPEDAGTFAKASDDVIKKRVIKVAKRRNPAAFTKGDDEKNSAFGGFAFTKTTPTNSNSSAFGFLSTLTSSKDTEQSKTNGDRDAPGTATNNSTSDDYYAKLKGLNESVLNWIKRHVDSNPLINLQPVFKDYEKYFDELEKLRTPEHSSSSSAAAAAASKLFNVDASEPAPRFNFGANNPPTFNFSGSANVPNFGNSVQTATNKSATITFCSNSTSTSTSGGGSTATLSFGDKKTTANNSFSFGTPSSLGSPTKSGFSFSSSTVSSSSSTISSAAPNTKTTEKDTVVGNDENDEDAPPKVEFTPVVEDGHVFKMRCKVFVKKDGTFGDRGVGNLYLKPIPNSEKTQLIVRADTNLGNLICNFILSEGVPTQRIGKKDVMLVCLPTPDTKPPPVPILLRVKTSEGADELLKTLEKHKK